MALRAKISKSEYDAMPEGVREHYTKKGAVYALDIDGDTEAYEEMQRARDHEKANVKAERDKRIAAESRASELEGGDANWKKKHGETETIYSERIARMQGAMGKAALGSVAGELASRVFGKHAKLGLPHITSRLQVKFDEKTDEPSIVVLDGSGKESTIEALEKEILSNADFSAIVTSTGASGGGARPSSGNSAPVQTGVPQNTSPISVGTMNDRQLAVHVAATRDQRAKENPNGTLD